MRFKISLGIMLFFALFLQGCGRKGPLILPYHQAPASQHLPASSVTPASVEKHS
jgi:predicted small lipoprotein YifL